MITPQEVLTLAESAGFTVIGNEILYGAGGLIRDASAEFTKIIEIAMEEGISKERKACIELLLSKRKLNCVSSLYWNIALVDAAEAIRNRGNNIG